MIRIVRASEADRALFYRTFTEGFSDYLIKLSMSEDEFRGHFFGAEGNDPGHSFIALETDGAGASERGVGVVLGGIRDFDGERTMRCGAMSVIPERRGTEVAGLLMDRHRQEALDQGCGQLFLEVIAANGRARRFYEKCGYTVRHELRYFVHADPAALARETGEEGASALAVGELSFAELRRYREALEGLHVNWQNEMDYIERAGGVHYGIREDGGRLAAALSMKGGSVKFLHVDESQRRRGYARRLLAHGVARALSDNPDLKAIRSSFPADAGLKAFYERLDFAEDALYQHEMVSAL